MTATRPTKVHNTTTRNDTATRSTRISDSGGRASDSSGRASDISDSSDPYPSKTAGMVIDSRDRVAAARHVARVYGGPHKDQPLLWHKRDPTANPRYKTALCSHYESGAGCPFGDACVYAHGRHELRELSAKAKALRAMKQRQRQEAEAAAVSAAQAAAQTKTEIPTADQPSAYSPSAMFGSGIWAAPTPEEIPRGAPCVPCSPDASVPADTPYTAAVAAEEVTEDVLSRDQAAPLARMVSDLTKSVDDIAGMAVAAPADAPAERWPLKLTKKIQWLAAGLAEDNMTEDEFKKQLGQQLAAAAPRGAASILEGRKLAWLMSGLQGEMLTPADFTTKVADLLSQQTADGSISEVFTSESDEAESGDADNAVPPPPPSPTSPSPADIAQFDALVKLLSETDDPAKLKKALQQNQVLANMQRSDGGKTLLMVAARNGRAQSVAEIGRHAIARFSGDSINTQTASTSSSKGPAGGYTALHYAAHHGHAKAAAALLKLGADPTLTNASGETPARAAMIKKHKELAAELKLAERARVGTATRGPETQNNAATASPPLPKNLNLAQGPLGQGFVLRRSPERGHTERMNPLTGATAPSSRSKWGGRSAGEDFAAARSAPVVLVD